MENTQKKDKVIGWRSNRMLYPTRTLQHRDYEYTQHGWQKKSVYSFRFPAIFWMKIFGSHK